MCVCLCVISSVCFISSAFGIELAATMNRSSARIHSIVVKQIRIRGEQNRYTHIHIWCVNKMTHIDGWYGVGRWICNADCWHCRIEYYDALTTSLFYDHLPIHAWNDAYAVSHISRTSATEIGYLSPYLLCSNLPGPMDCNGNQVEIWVFSIEYYSFIRPKRLIHFISLY